MWVSKKRKFFFLFSITVITFCKYKQQTFKSSLNFVLHSNLMFPSGSLFIRHLLKQLNVIKTLPKVDNSGARKHFLLLRYRDFGHYNSFTPQQRNSCIPQLKPNVIGTLFSMQTILSVFWEKLSEAKAAAFKVMPRALPTLKLRWIQMYDFYQ